MADLTDRFKRIESRYPIDFLNAKKFTAGSLFGIGSIGIAYSGVTDMDIIAHITAVFVVSSLLFLLVIGVLEIIVAKSTKNQEIYRAAS